MMDKVHAILMALFLFTAATAALASWPSPNFRRAAITWALAAVSLYLVLSP